MGVLTWMLWFVQASLLFTQITDLQNWDVVQCDKDLHFTRGMSSRARAREPCVLTCNLRSRVLDMDR